eukprot:1141920-Rhodomonas_salina.1
MLPAPGQTSVVASAGFPAYMPPNGSTRDYPSQMQGANNNNMMPVPAPTPMPFNPYGECCARRF